MKLIKNPLHFPSVCPHTLTRHPPRSTSSAGQKCIHFYFYRFVPGGPLSQVRRRRLWPIRYSLTWCAWILSYPGPRVKAHFRPTSDDSLVDNDLDAIFLDLFRSDSELSLSGAPEWSLPAVAFGHHFSLSPR